MAAKTSGSGAATELELQWEAILKQGMEELLRNSTEVEFLRRELMDQPMNLLDRLATKEYSEQGNIIHLAVFYDRQDFVKDAIKRLHEKDVYLLLSEKVPAVCNTNPLHVAVMKGQLGVVEAILDFYDRIHVENMVHIRPWFVKGFGGATPLHLALMKKHEECALKILSVSDQAQVGKLNFTPDDKDETPFSLAVKQGCEKVVDKIFKLFLKFPKAQSIRHMFHVAASLRRQDLVRDAINILQRQRRQAVYHALFQQKKESEKRNLLHVAAIGGNPGIINLMLDFYKDPANISLKPKKPWTKKDSIGKRPLDYALTPDKEECACRILSMDLRIFCKLLDVDGNSVLFIALEKGLKQVASKILESGFPYNVTRKDGSTVLQVIHESCLEFCDQLLEQQPKLMKLNKKGVTTLHSWLEKGNLGPIKHILETRWRGDLIKLICDKNDNPFHVIATSEFGLDVEAAQLLIEAYRQERLQALSTIDTEPWLMTNKNGHTPLQLAIDRNREKLASYLILVQIGSDDRDTEDGPLYLAVKKGCNLLVKSILPIISKDKNRWCNLLTSADDQNVLHVASKCSPEVGSLLVKQYPELASKIDNAGHEPLCYAAEADAEWLIKKLVKITPLKDKTLSDCINEAFKGVKLSAKNAFTGNQRFINACRGSLILHSVKLNTCKEYEELLAVPFIRDMKNSIDSNGDTPLHLALRYDNLEYAEALLAAGVDESIKNANDETALHLLIEKCKQPSARSTKDWTTMTQRVGIFQKLTDFEQVRGPLAVVAALTATLTFAAGFTLPGGFNNDTGKAILSKKASFCAFLLADAYALCSSILALFFLTAFESRDDLIVSLSIKYLVILLVRQSLYGSLVAFMTGVYAVISHHTWWLFLPIVVFFMCSCAFVFSFFFTGQKTLLRKLSPLIDLEGSASKSSENSSRLVSSNFQCNV